MVLVQKFDAWAEQNAHDIYLEVVAWSDESQVGKVHKERIFTTDKSGKGWPNKVLMNWGLATGVLTEQAVRESQASGQMADLDTDAMVGRPVMTKIIEDEKYTKIDGIGIEVYSILHPKKLDWPRHGGIEAQWKGKLPQSESAPKSANGQQESGSASMF